MLAIVLILGLFQSLQDEYVAKLTAFDQHYEYYKLDLLGCPERYKKQRLINLDDCDPKNGSINVKEWLAARREAKKLWGLQDSKEDDQQ